MVKQPLYTIDDELIGFIELTDTHTQIMNVGIIDHLDNLVKQFPLDKDALLMDGTETGLTNRVKSALSIDDISDLETTSIASQISNIFAPHIPKKEETKTDQPTVQEDIVNSYPDDIRELADLLLNEGDAFNFILETWQLRHVGDEIVGKNCLCAAASTFISNTRGSHLKPNGESGKGKSSGIETFLECLPPRKYISGSMSAKSAFYDDRLKPGMILYSDDAHLNDDMIATVKQSTSSFQKPTEHHTVKKQESHQCLIPERISWWFTSVDSFDDDQLANRFLNADVDGSVEQDKAVADFILESESALFGESDEDIQVCRCAYDILDSQTYNILIPYATCIEWNNPENRRNLTKFLDMIRAVAFYNIKQREAMTIKNGQETVYFATIDDYFRALEIYQVNAGKNATNLSEKEMEVFRFFASNCGKEIALSDIAKRMGKSQQTARNLMHGRDGTGGLLSKIVGLECHNMTFTVRTDEQSRGTQKNIYRYNGTSDLKIWDTSISSLDAEKCKEIITKFKESLTDGDTNRHKHDSNDQMFELKTSTRDRIIKTKTNNNNNIYRDKNVLVSNAENISFSHESENCVSVSENESTGVENNSNNTMFESVCGCLSEQDEGIFEKISYFVEKFQKEYGPINKSNLKDATHLISSWSTVKPSETKSILEKLCNIGSVVA